MVCPFFFLRIGLVDSMEKILDAIAVIILAAGKGTRMHSDKAKVLHPLHGKPMILHVLQTARAIAGNDIVVVVGHQAETVKDLISKAAKVFFAVQEEQKGTGHAVQCAIPELPAHCEQIVILSGDVPLIRATTLCDLVSRHMEQKNDITLLGVCLPNPFGYGRIVADATGGVERIVEEKDATAPIKAINTVNAGIYCVDKNFLTASLAQLTPDNHQNEIYLTDIVGVARRSGMKIGLMICQNQREVMGVNTPHDLMDLEAVPVEY